MIAASSDISNVPADFVKFFVQLVVFFLGAGVTGYVAYRKGRQANGSRDEPVNIAQPLEIKHQTRYAHKAEVDKIQTIIAENSKAGDERRVEIIQAIHGSEQRMIQEVKDLHERLNPVAEGFRAHAALLDQIDKRLSASELARRDETARMQQQIYDAIRTASTKNKS